MADKFINPFTDFGFKKIFGQEENKDLLIDFIQTLLPEKGNIINIRYLKTEKLGRAISERRAIFDLYCENDLGEKFIVELQRAQQDYFKERSIYYATFAIQEQAKKGKWDYNWQGVYTIAIMDFSFTDSPHKNVKTQAVLYDEENEVIFSDKLKFVYLEMDKFTKSIDELENYYEKWLYLLKNLSFLDKIPAKLREKAFQKVFQIAEIAKYNPKERQKYEDSLKHYRDIENSLDLKFEEGRGIGSQERAFVIAQNMKNKGFSVQDIIEFTGLTESEINQI
ncbi:MAG: Rpn family recombination-promoting nuclease/putative transposase [Bacteroidetes bacterium]|nr:MAG: Rpn family recombination-promoting nuclease/putative transposase [Bacteroidota bacterium]